MTSQDDQGNDRDVFTLYPSDGSFTIKTRKISLKSARVKRKGTYELNWTTPRWI